MKIASLLALFTLCSVPLAAADFPKSGEAEYDTFTYSKLWLKWTAALAGGIDEFTGLMRNVKEDGPFHDMSVHCLGHWTMIKDDFNFDGSCVETDKDGYIVGGTGKYKGIIGKALISAPGAAPVQGLALRPSVVGAD